MKEATDINKISFELEQAIMVAWGITDDLQLVAENVKKGILSGQHRDELLDLLLGMKQLQQLRFEKLFSLFEEIHSFCCQHGLQK